MQLHSTPTMGSAKMTRQSSAQLHTHTVQFYESDAFLSKVVADYIANGLGNGQPAVVIATAAHVQQIWGHLRLKGFEPDLLEHSGQLQLLDADSVMAKFMVKGYPDAGRFNSVLHGVMRKAMTARPNRTVRAYGEMVDILCQTDNARAAIELERLWNEAAKRYDFSLLCGYDMRSFSGSAGPSVYASVCGLHDHAYRPET